MLKQASNLTAFFEHLVVPGVVVEHYAHDLSDLPVRAATLLQELRVQPDRLLRMAGVVGYYSSRVGWAGMGVDVMRERVVQHPYEVKRLTLSSNLVM